MSLVHIGIGACDATVDEAAAVAVAEVGVLDSVEVVAVA
jgi:hypothetical protein